MVSCEGAGHSFDEEKERALNRHLWSQAYVQRSPTEWHEALVRIRAAAT
jgi:hypothetical protein